MERAAAEITLEDFRKSYGVGGIDLSQTTDLTAATVIVERRGKLYAFTQFFMPANRVERATAIDGVPYDIFVKKGIVTLSGENYVDYKDVFKWFVMLKEKYEIYVLKVGYDRYSAQYLVDDMRAYGFHMDDVFQGENLIGTLVFFRSRSSCQTEHQSIEIIEQCAVFLENGAMRLVYDNKIKPTDAKLFFLVIDKSYHGLVGRKNNSCIFITVKTASRVY